MSLARAIATAHRTERRSCWELLRMLNDVFDGYFTKIIDEDDENFYVFDKSKNETVAFNKRELAR